MKQASARALFEISALAIARNLRAQLNASSKQTTTCTSTRTPKLKPKSTSFTCLRFEPIERRSGNQVLSTLNEASPNSFPTHHGRTWLAACSVLYTVLTSHDFSLLEPKSTKNRLCPKAGRKPAGSSLLSCHKRNHGSFQVSIIV